MPYQITPGKRRKDMGEERSAHRTLQNGRSPKFRFICSGHILFQQHTGAPVRNETLRNKLTAESRGSHQEFPRDSHRICEFQRETVELVDTRLPSPKPTPMSKRCRAENQDFSSLKMRPQAKHILPSSVSSFPNWKSYDKKT